MRIPAIFRTSSVIVVSVLAGCGIWSPKDERERFAASSEGVGVVVTPVHHLGKSYSVDRIFINDFPAGEAGPEGGGGSRSCCVMLPYRWRPGLAAKITWTVLDWKHENLEELKKGIHRSVRVDSAYEADVPVEYYDEPNTVYIHIFKDGRARVVSSIYAPLSERHPVKDGNYDDTSATVGKRIRSNEDGQPWTGW